MIWTSSVTGEAALRMAAAGEHTGTLAVYLVLAVLLVVAVAYFYGQWTR